MYAKRWRLQKVRSKTGDLAFSFSHSFCWRAFTRRFHLITRLRFTYPSSYLSFNWRRINLSLSPLSPLSISIDSAMMTSLRVLPIFLLICVTGMSIAGSLTTAHKHRISMISLGHRLGSEERSLKHETKAGTPKAGKTPISPVAPLTKSIKSIKPKKSLKSLKKSCKKSYKKSYKKSGKSSSSSNTAMPTIDCYYQGTQVSHHFDQAFLNNCVRYY